MRLETQFSQPPQTTAFQKLFMLLGAGIFVALASLTASLPLPLPTHQDDPATFATSDGDTAWVIIATIFGVLAAPAATYLFGTCNLSIPHVASSKILVFSIFSELVQHQDPFAVAHGRSHDCVHLLRLGDHHLLFGLGPRYLG